MLMDYEPAILKVSFLDLAERWSKVSRKWGFMISGITVYAELNCDNQFIWSAFHMQCPSPAAPVLLQRSFYRP